RSIECPDRQSRPAASLYPPGGSFLFLCQSRQADEFHGDDRLQCLHQCDRGERFSGWLRCEGDRSGKYGWRTEPYRRCEPGVSFAEDVFPAGGGELFYGGTECVLFEWSAEPDPF